METATIPSTEKGIDLHATYWFPAASVSARALVCLSHGFSEHLGLYDELSRRLCAEGEAVVFGHDHRGHGRSHGKRAYIEDVADYARDVIQHCKLMKEKHGDLPLFLVGHSMGGMVAIEVALMADADFFQGVVLQGALVIPGPTLLNLVDFRVTPLRSLVVSSLLSVLDLYDPELVLGRADLAIVTSDEQMRRRLAQDPLRWTGGCKVRLLLAFVRCLEQHLRRLPELTLPMLILHGTNDSLCNVEGSRLLYSSAGSVDKQLHEFEGAVHQLYLERLSVRDAATAKTINWIRARSCRHEGGDGGAEKGLMCASEKPHKAVFNYQPDE